MVMLQWMGWPDTGIEVVVLEALPVQLPRSATSLLLVTILLP